MIRTQIQLSEDDYARLRAVAGTQKRSMADCIREAIQAFLRNTGTGEEGAIERVAGRFRPLRLEGLKKHDRGFAEAIAGSKGRRRR